MQSLACRSALSPHRVQHVGGRGRVGKLGGVTRRHTCGGSDLRPAESSRDLDVVERSTADCGRGPLLLSQRDALTLGACLSLDTGRVAAGFQYHPRKRCCRCSCPTNIGRGNAHVQRSVHARACDRPRAAGLVLRAWGVRTTFRVNAMSFVAVLVALLFVRERETPAVKDRGRSHRQFIDAHGICGAGLR